MNGFGRRAITSTVGSTTYSVTNTLPADFLFAIASAQGEPFTRIAVKRAVSASTLDLDFNTESAPAATKAFVVTGLGVSDTQSHSIIWQTTGSSSMLFAAATNTANASDTYSAIDSSLVQPGDIYRFSAQALQGGATEVKTDLWGQFATPTDISFPVAYVSATASVATPAAPYGRVQVDINAYPGAQFYAMEASGQVVSGKPTVEWWVSATPDWFAGAAPYRLAMPNLDSASGWDNAKGFTPGSRATIVAFTSIQSTLSDGSQTIVAQQNGLFAIP
jgi:hypothetical protein